MDRFNSTGKLITDSKVEIIANMFSVKMNQWFKFKSLIGDSEFKYKFTEDGLFNDCDYPCPGLLMGLINGFEEISWREENELIYNEVLLGKKVKFKFLNRGFFSNQTFDGVIVKRGNDIFIEFTTGSTPDEISHWGYDYYKLNEVEVEYKIVE